MKASIVVATYNRKDKLKKCLNALANQTYPQDNYEIIIVDDGSTDGTYEFLKEKQKEIEKLRRFGQNNKDSLTVKLRTSLQNRCDFLHCLISSNRTYAKR